MKTMTMPGMPEIWSYNQEILIHVNDACGSLAKWAVKQSPYFAPGNLSEGIAEFHRVWSRRYGKSRADFVPFQPRDLRKAVEEAIECCPLIKKWNDRKNEREGHGFCDRYSQPNPDDDFIDLGALARNIAHDMILDEVYQKQHDKETEKV